MERLKTKDKVVGVNQTKKAIADKSASVVYIASDADDRVITPIENLALASGLSVVHVDTMKQLGTACGIDVGAAAAALLG